MTEKFVITGMTCAACAAHVERAAASVPGVHSASVNLMLGSLVCDRDENVDPAAIVAAVIITVLAFAVGMTLVILHNKRRR